MKKNKWEQTKHLKYYVYTAKILQKMQLICAVKVLDHITLEVIVKLNTMLWGWYVYACSVFCVHKLPWCSKSINKQRFGIKLVSAHGWVLNQTKCVYCSTDIAVSYLFISMVTGDRLTNICAIYTFQITVVS